MIIEYDDYLVFYRFDLAEIEDLIKGIERLVTAYQLAEDLWLTPAMRKYLREQSTEKAKKRLEDFERSKLRVNWLYAALFRCESGLYYLPNPMAEELLVQYLYLLSKVKRASTTGSKATNKKLVEQVEDFLKKIKVFLQERIKSLEG